MTLAAPIADAYCSTVTPLGMMRYSPGNRLAGKASAAGDTAMRTSSRFCTRSPSHIQRS